MANMLTDVASKFAGTDVMRRVTDHLPEIEHNVGEADRLLSLAVGGFLTVTGLTGHRVNLFSSLIGGALLYRGLSGHCPFMQALGMNTCRSEGRGEATVIEAGGGVRIEHSVTVNKSPEELYRFWRKLENLPKIMSHLKEVKETGAYKSHWVARGPLGMSVEWDAEITNDRPNEAIAWRLLDGSEIATAGSVHFRESPANGWTEIRVNLKYDPPAGKLGAAAAWLFGEEPNHQVRHDLAKFKETMEGGQKATAGNGNR